MTKKAKFLQKINEAFAKSDTDYIADNVTKNIRWTVIGDQTVEGKEAFIQALKAMEAEEPMELTIHHIITHGKEASVDLRAERARIAEGQWKGDPLYDKYHLPRDRGLRSSISAGCRSLHGLFPGVVPRPRILTT